MSLFYCFRFQDLESWCSLRLRSLGFLWYLCWVDCKPFIFFTSLIIINLYNCCSSRKFFVNLFTAYALLPVSAWECLPTPKTAFFSHNGLAYPSARGPRLRWMLPSYAAACHRFDLLLPVCGVSCDRVSVLSAAAGLYPILYLAYRALLAQGNCPYYFYQLTRRWRHHQSQKIYRSMIRLRAQRVNGAMVPSAAILIPTGLATHTNMANALIACMVIMGILSMSLLPILALSASRHVFTQRNLIFQTITTITCMTLIINIEETRTSTRQIVIRIGQVQVEGARSPGYRLLRRYMMQSMTMRTFTRRMKLDYLEWLCKIIKTAGFGKMH